MPATTPTSPYVLIDGARILYAPLLSVLPADSLALAGAWPAAWKEVGYTNEPTKFNTSFDVYKMMVQQRQTFIYKKKTSSDISFETRLVDFSADTLKSVLGGTKTTLVGGAGLPPVDVYTYTADTFIPSQMWGIEGGFIANNTVYPVRIIVHSGSPSDGTDFEINKESEAGTMLKVEAASLADGTVYQVRWVTGASVA